MSLIQAALLAVLPPNRKRTPSGWESFNAPCCHNRGDRRDDRKRGGIMVSGDAFTFHCFQYLFYYNNLPYAMRLFKHRYRKGWHNLNTYLD
jgi:hypothetical protein